MGKINAVNNQALEFTIDPGGSGDSFIQFDINTTGKFRIGVDDDAGDAFKISYGSALGSNDTFNIAATGEITMPLQPAFFARNTSEETDATGDGTIVSVTFGSESFDQGSDFASSTFTAPVTGIYYFSVSLYFSDISDTAPQTDCKIYFSATGGDYTVMHLNFLNSIAFPTSSGQVCNGTAIVPMTASDTIVVKTVFSGGNKEVDIRTDGFLTSFKGYLIC